MSEIEKFEHYEVQRREDGSLFELGRGAMGITYKAFDTDLHCLVALKVINSATIAGEDAEQRFLREARSAAQLRHPNIAAVFRLGKTGEGTVYYAMEFCEGKTLQQIVEAEGPLDCARALQFTLQVTKALIVAEEHHLVHRDLKPANLIVTQRSDEGEVIKVIDFGLAKTTAPEGTMWSSMGTHGFIGTAHFASPEQIEDKPVDTRSDIYSLGATLWFMLLGRPMFEGSLARIMSQHLTAPPDFSLLQNFPADVVTLLERMLEKDAGLRPQSALALRREIAACVDVTDEEEERRDSRAQPQPPPVPPPGSRPVPEVPAPIPPAPPSMRPPVPAGPLSLLDLLRARGALAPSEVLRLGQILAARLDAREPAGPAVPGLDKRQITIHFQEKHSAEQARARLRETVTSWPRFDLVVEDSSEAPPADEDSMATILPQRESSADGVQQFGRLMYELLGGSASQRYVPVASLGEDGNKILQRATLTGAAAYLSAGALIVALTPACGAAAAPVIAAPRPEPVAPPGPRPAAPRPQPVQPPQPPRPTGVVPPVLPPTPQPVPRPDVPVSPATPRRSGRRWLLVASVLVVGMLVMLIAVGAINRRDRESSSRRWEAPLSTPAPVIPTGPVQFTLYDSLGKGQVSETVWVYVDDRPQPVGTIQVNLLKSSDTLVVPVDSGGDHFISVNVETIVRQPTGKIQKKTSSNRWQVTLRGGEAYELGVGEIGEAETYEIQLNVK